ncbi:hypothetical protein IAR55_004680 [Kwoniella newhampshirensis]|uniref:NADH:flavin oxidoreductase/NADH oxidase N-terminal domain-containing protein n=1 Tax=Kwoniella newhampshirensis TaxID=1651941 RepID=A0AAW0Z103_9TREE
MPTASSSCTSLSTPAPRQPPHTPSPATVRGSPSYKRTPSVSDAVKQYEARSANSTPTTPPRSSPRPPITPSHSSNGGQSRRGSTAEDFAEENLTERREDQAGMGTKSRVIGMGVPGLLKDRGEGRSISDTTSGLPARLPNGSRSHIPTLNSSPRPFPQGTSGPQDLHPTPASPSAASSRRSWASRPNAGVAFPRSTSDSVITPPQSNTPMPSLPVAGPSRLVSPGRRGNPTVAISVSRPSPNKQASPSSRPKSFQPELVPPFPSLPPAHTHSVSPTVPSPAEGRRPNHQLSSSVSSQGFSSRREQVYDHSSLGDPAMVSLEEEQTMSRIPVSVPMGHRGEGSASRSSFDRVLELSSPRSSTSGSSIRSTRLSSGDIRIPRRTSSAKPPPPSSPSSTTFPSGPNISPRGSSFYPNGYPISSPPSPIAARRASKGVAMLGETVAAPPSTKRSDRPSLGRGSSAASSISRASKVTSSTMATNKRPSPMTSPQQSPQPSRRPSHQNTRPSPHLSPQASPTSSPSRRLSTLPYSSSPRKSPGLTIDTPPPFLHSRLSSTSSIPTPPVPVKSPLRGISRQGSGLADFKGHPSRSVSVGSISGGNDTPTSNGAEETTTPGSCHDSPSTRLQMRTPFDTSSSNDRQDDPSIATGPPSQIITTPTDEIRFTMLTVPSEYSQDSAPPSASSWALSQVTTRSSDSAHEDADAPQRRPSRLESVGWGQKRDGQEKDHRQNSGRRGSAADGRTRHSTSLSRLTMPVDKDLPKPPGDTPNSAETFGSSGVSNNGVNGHTPLSTSPADAFDRKESMKEPFLSGMRNQIQSREVTRGASTNPQTKAATEPFSALLPPATLRPDINQGPSLRPLLPSSPSIVMTKRSHLIREIASTERAYAKDLSLLRDAYMHRFLRPVSQHSTITNGDSSISPGNASDASRRSSIYTYQTAETKRSSGYDTPGLSIENKGSTSHLPKSPSDGLNLGYFGSNGANSAASSQAIPLPSPRKGSRSSMNTPMMPPPVGKPLSPVDMKTVFLNIDQLAGVADELASAFEKAKGDEETGPGAIARDGEAGTDRLGHTFVTMCTTPVHPDYYAIKTAAQISRAVAMEIDESKRRKDVVSHVIGSKKLMPTVASLKEAKQPTSKLLGLARFRKDKQNLSITSLPSSTSSKDSSSPATISESSLTMVKELATKIEELDKCVKRVGKDIVFWTAAAKETFVAQDEMVQTWLRVVQLEPPDPTDQRLLEFRRVIDAIVSEEWGRLNDEVKHQIIPTFGKLLEISVNPRKVINKRDSKLPDYTRYHALRVTKKAIDRTLAQGAVDFVALHTQLVEELPAFAEGYMRILDIAVVAFARAQTKYHDAVRGRLSSFAKTWIQPPQSLNASDDPIDVSTSRGIVKTWHDSWAPYAEAMEHFQCTKPTRGVPSRIATFNGDSRHNDQSVVRSASPTPVHALRHSASITSPSSSSDSRPSSPALRSGGRFRSSSLRSQTGPTIITTSAVSPVKEGKEFSRFSLLRRSNSKTSVPKVDRAVRPPLSPRHSSGLRPSSMSMSSDASSRMSWGLPQIAADGGKSMFEGLGLSPTKSFKLTDQPRSTSDPRGYAASSAHSAVNPYDNASYDHEMTGSHISLASTNPGLGFGDLERAEEARRKSGSSNPAVTAIFTASATRSSSSGSPVSSVSTARSKKSGKEIDVAEGWRNEKVMYQCACVADFDPLELGNKKYRGLKFLPMSSGDMIDVFHEVGRIDELPSFPYPEVGVDDDGVLVGRAEDGICNEEQIAVWKKITAGVHAKNGKIFCQLYGAGRMADPDVVPRVYSPNGQSWPPGAHKVTPMSGEDIRRFVEHFRQAAINSIEAGFDGVEIHCANGYLLDEFIQSVSNDRTDAYGGSLENRFRFPIEVINAVSSAIGGDRVGVRISPYSRFQGMRESDPLSVFVSFVESVVKAQPSLAYIHAIEGRIEGSTDAAEEEVKEEDTLDEIRDVVAKHGRAFIVAGGYTPEKARTHAEKYDDLIAFGRWFIPNPDLPERIKNDWPLTKYDRSTFYTPTAEGYIDYPPYTAA